MAYFLFILVNAALFIRPGELFPAFATWPIYNYLILACFAVAAPRVAAQLAPQALIERPVTVCVLGLLAAVVMSHLSHFFIWGARMSGFDFLKIVIYYLLLVTVIDSTARLRGFLAWIVLFTTAATTLAVLQFHDVIDLPALRAFEQREFNPETGRFEILARLKSTGIFNDPNDLCLVLLMAISAALYLAGDRRSGPLRLVWLGLLPLFGYAMMQTHSRGGFVALLAAMLVLFHSRYGLKKTVPLAAVALPVMFVLFAGRQTNIDISSGSGQGRIQLWSAGLRMFKGAPVFGIGQGQYAEEVGLVAHNSFVHCYAELGFFGGTLFLGAFFYPLWTLHRLGKPRVQFLDGELRRMRPFLMAMVAAYAAGQLSLSRAYIVPTYTVLGIAAAYLHLAAVHPPLPIRRFDHRLVMRLSTVGCCFILATYMYVRTFARWG